MKKSLLPRAADEDAPVTGPPATPRWVKVLGIIALVLALLLAIILVTGVGGEHGPSRHLPPGDAGGAPPIEQGRQQP